MKVSLVLFALLISGCATNAAGPFHGNQARNIGPVRYSRLGAITNEDIPNLQRCGTNRISWCSGPAAGDNCRCLYIHEAQDKAREMLRRRGSRGH